MGLRTPLHAAHIKAGGRMVDFGGWDMPLQYSSIKEEHLAVRRVAGVFDLSHMGRVVVSGPGAAGFLQELLTNDVQAVAPGRAQYTLMCREDGGIIDDLVIYRRSSEDFLVVVNASNREKDLAWMRERAPAAVELADRTSDLALIALQGPRAQALLPADVDLESIPYFGFAEGTVAGVPALIARTGYTGEDGFELFLAADRAVSVWDVLIDPGQGLLPAGLGARDACRLEAGLRLYGNDMDETTDPFDAGLGWTVKLTKGTFVGSEALAARKQAGPRREVLGLAGLERTIPRHGAEVSKGGRPVGTVLSGTYSFFLERGIGMASVDKGAVVPGDQVEVDQRGKPGLAEVTQLPIYRGSVRSPRPARPVA